MITSFQLEIDIAEQTLSVFHNDRLWQSYSVSTAANGVGEQSGSGQTPRGWHQIRAKIGADQPLGAVFVGRRPTGEVYSPQLAAQYPQRDWILTRILWLSGLEVGKNRLGQVDTMRRYIYIHGTPDEYPMGQPQSHGCIRMRNHELRQLFDHIPVGTQVHIS